MGGRPVSIPFLAVRLRRLLAPAIAALICAALLVPAVAGTALAAGITFSSPSADPVWGDGITFSVSVTTPADAVRAELRLTFPDTLGPYIIDVEAPSAGTSTLHYKLDTTGTGFLAPNTRLEAAWAVYPAAGVDPVISATQSVHYQDTSHTWKVMHGDVVTFHWYQGSEDFARKALKIGDDAVQETAALLGVTENDRIDFYAYGDEASFREAMGPGTRENVGGRSHADIRTMFALLTPSEIGSSWVSIVIPHELVHLVFDTAVKNPYRFPPRWVNEGLATYLSEGYTGADRGNIKDAIRSGDLLPLSALTGQFPTDPAKTYLAYSEAVSGIDHLVKTYGKDALLSLVAAYRDGLTDDEALVRATGVDMATFEAGWLKSIGAEAPTQYGPQPDPEGPLPPGWDQPIATAHPGSGGSPAPSDASARPGTTATPGSTAAPGDSGDGGSVPSDGGMLIAAVVVVVMVALVGWLVAARRRRATP